MPLSVMRITAIPICWGDDSFGKCKSLHGQSKARESVGHDSLFIKNSEAPVTTPVVKDRVLGHNPVAALYETHSYYRRLLTPPEDPEEKS